MPPDRRQVPGPKPQLGPELRRYRQAQELAGAWVSTLDANPKGDVGRLLQEMLKTIAFHTLAAMGQDLDSNGQPAVADPRDLVLLAKALKDMAGAEKISTELELKLRRDLAARIGDDLQAAEAAADGGRAASQRLRQALARIRTEIYGLDQPHEGQGNE